MFADPQAIKQDGTTNVSFPRTGVGNGVGTWTSPDGLMVASVRQTSTKARFRREMRIVVTKVSADALNPAINTPKSASVYLVVDQPIVGFTADELKNAYKAIDSWSAGQIDHLLLGES